MPNLDFDVCDGTTFKELCAEILRRSTSKRDQLDTLLTDVRGHIKNINDAQVFLPHVKELLAVGIKNDEQLIKLATVVEKLQSTQLEASGGDTAGLSDEEKEQLVQAAASEKLKEIQKEIMAPLSASLS